MAIINIKFAILLFFLTLIFRSKSSSQEKYLINDCFTLRPVFNDSKFDEPQEFHFTHESIDSLYKSILTNKINVRYDSSMDFVTGFGFQMRISINYDCYNKLKYPDSSFLIEIYNIPSYNSAPLISSVKFIKCYIKNILIFGKALIYEYQFINVVEASPHYMFIIISLKSNNNFEEDYKGIVICSDGMKWKDFINKNCSFPEFIYRIRIAKQIEIPLYYDGRRFIPIGHNKIGNWE